MHRVVERIYSMHIIIDDFIRNPMNSRFGVGFARELKKQVEVRFETKEQRTNSIVWQITLHLSSKEFTWKT